MNEINGNLVIGAGNIRLTINGDPDNILEFNPNDLFFVDRAYQLAERAAAKQEEYKRKALALEKKLKNADPAEIMRQKRTYVKLACLDIYAELDEVFGPGVSDRVFKGRFVLEEIEQFLDGINPYFSEARAPKINKHLADDEEVIEVE